MVAFLPALSVGLTSLTAFFLLYPRLPQYSFQIRSVWPLWSGQEEGSGLRARLGANVRLKNDNYVAIDIHALSFDLFYSDWMGKIQVLGNVQDASDRILYLEDYGRVPPRPNSDRNASSTTSDSSSTDVEFSINGGSSSSGSSSSFSSHPPLWHMEARRQFETQDVVIMTPLGGLSVIANLMWDMIQNYGVVDVRSTGAIHIKANGQIPMTLNILCDNVLDVWTMEMQGMRCTLDRLDVGWKSLPSAMEALRKTFLHQYQHQHQYQHDPSGGNHTSIKAMEQNNNNLHAVDG